jgi:phosphatidylglycerol lysyltransferase
VRCYDARCMPTRVVAPEVTTLAMPESITSERARVLELVRRYGWNATAFQTLEQGYRYFFHDQGCVAYFDTGGAWVAAGAPIAPVDAMAGVVRAFVAQARGAHRRCCFFAAEQRLVNLTGDQLRSLRIGEQPVWDPQDWPEILRRRASLREQLRRARAKGVTVREVTTDELRVGVTRDGIARVTERWLSSRALAPMDFLVRLELFSFTEERRCFVAELGGRVVGVAGVVPVPARAGWFIEDLVRDPSAPNGTGELLIDAVMRWAAALSCNWLTLGLAPLAGDVSPLLRAARTSSSLLYDFNGLRTYKAKLQPEHWLPIFLSYPPSQGAFVSLLDALIAFTKTGFWHFAWRTLTRGPIVVVRALAVLLLPWTLLLAVAPAERWFGAAWLKWAWVMFDLLLAAGLFRFLRERRTSLLTVLAVAVTADAVLTPLQALLWNLPHAEGAFDYLAVAVGCLAPVLAAIVLWGARRARVAAG